MTPVWRRSSRCDTQTCVEVAYDGERRLMRDSKQAGWSPVLEFGHEAWAAFVADIKAGELG